MGNPTHFTNGCLTSPTTNPLIRVAQPSISSPQPTPFPPSAAIAPSSPADPTIASALPPLPPFPSPRHTVAASPSIRRDCSGAPCASRRDASSPPPLPLAAIPRCRLPPPAAAPALASPGHPSVATPRRRLPLTLPRCHVTASPYRCCAFLGAACASRRRDALSPFPVPPPRLRVAACMPHRRDLPSPPARPIAATCRRRLHIPLPRPARRRLHVPPPRLRVAACASRRRDLLVVACTPRRRDLPSPLAHPAAATRSSPPARPAAATSRRRLRIPPPRPSRRRLYVPPPRPTVAACTSRRRDLFSPPAHPAAATSSLPPTHPAAAIHS
ncbi:unnamed protein product [Closterium sp. NIES-65]|nr:unnamed protein product [Closterium sp. NIES-65]